MSRLRRFDEFVTGCRTRVDAVLAPPAVASIADLKAHLERDAHLTPEQLADYQHRIAQYARSGEPLQPDLDLEPPSCA